jgi:transposase InsO family protein
MHAACWGKSASKFCATRSASPQPQHRTNGKAERFIQTSLREWAYARPYASSQERSTALMPWLDHYSTERPHAALAHHPPAARLRQSQLLGSTEARCFVPTCRRGPMLDDMNNLLGNDS